MAAPPTFVRAPEATASDLFQTSDLDEPQVAMASTYGHNRIRRTSRGPVNLNLWLTRAGRMNLGYTNTLIRSLRSNQPPRTG